jgi:hypothetical protein
MSSVWEPCKYLFYGGFVCGYGERAIDNQVLSLGAPLLHGFWTHEWRDVYVPITAVNATSRTIYASDPTHVAFNDGTRNIKRSNSRWYALNIRSELDQPGEYYIHRNATNRESAHGMVYFIPPRRANATSAGALTGAPALPAFVSAKASVLVRRTCGS